MPRPGVRLVEDLKRGHTHTKPDIRSEFLLTNDLFAYHATALFSRASAFRDEHACAVVNTQAGSEQVAFEKGIFELSHRDARFIHEVFSRFSGKKTREPMVEFYKVLRNAAPF